MQAIKDDTQVYDRMIDSRPIVDMMDMLYQAGRKTFNDEGTWEVCLCALILTLEPKCGIQRVLESLPYRETALDDVDMLNCMAHLGYFCRQSEENLEDIDERLLPAVFIPETGTPSIILGRGDDGGLFFFDPLSKMISTAPPSIRSGGRVWFFQKYDENRQPISKFMRKGSGHGWFRALMVRFNDTFVQVMTVGLILNIIALATPLFVMVVYDRVIAAGSAGTLPMLAFGAFMAIAFEWMLRNVRSTGLSWLAGRLDNIVGNRIYAHLIGLSPDLIEKASVAAQIARIKTFESVRDFFSGSVFLSVMEGPFVFLSIIAIAFIAGPLVFVPLFMIAAYMTLFYAVRAKVKISIRLAAKTSSARQQFTIETFEKLEDIRGQGLTRKWQEKFRHLSGREMMSHFYLGWLGSVGETLAKSLTVIAAVATVGFGVHMVWAGAMSTGALVATMILVWRILTPFYALCTILPRLEQLRNSILQVNDLMDIDTEREEAQSFSRLPSIRGDISFQNVAFRYTETGDDIMSGLSFDAKAGDIVAVTGNNGAGKATILKLVKSLYHPSHGVVRIDGFDIRQLDAPDLRRQIAYVPKNPHFFQGTVAENLRFCKPLATAEEIREALEIADALADTEHLPHGIDTVIGMQGDVKLTANLATRLSLARAFLHPGNILLIDELPNELLSGTTGDNLKKYLARIKGKRTVIICTYREDYMAFADIVVWLRGLAEPLSGPRDDIINRMNQSMGTAA